FGLAQVLEGNSGDIRCSRVGYTPYYAAPEIWEDRITRWTDQYALAISYYKLRTGSLPFGKTSLPEVMMAHLDGDLDFALVTGAEKDALVRATAIAPESRHANCVEFARLLADSTALAERPYLKRSSASNLTNGSKEQSAPVLDPDTLGGGAAS